jgi:hypothetical protein
MGTLLANLVNPQSTGDIICLALGGSWGTFYSINGLMGQRKIKRRLQFLELRQHLREELFVPK